MKRKMTRIGMVFLALLLIVPFSPFMQGEVSHAFAESDNLALDQTYKSSSNIDSDQSAEKAFDGDFHSDWQAEDSRNEWIQVDFGEDMTFNKAVLSDYGNRVRNYRIEYWNGSDWNTAYSGTTIGRDAKTVKFPEVTGNKARLYISKSDATPIIYEFQIYHTNGNDPSIVPEAPDSLTATAKDGQADLTWSASNWATDYNVKQSTTSGDPYTKVAHTSDTDFTVRGLENGKKYYFVVTAINENGESEPTSEVSVTPVKRGENLALGHTYSSSSHNNSDQTVDKAFDEDLETPWQATDDDSKPWIEVDFGEAASFNEAVITAYGNRIESYRIEYWDGSQWKIAYSGGEIGTSPGHSEKIVRFPEVTGTKARILITGKGAQPIIYEFEIYYSPPEAPATLSSIAGDGQVTLEWPSSNGALNYDVKQSKTKGGEYSKVANVEDTHYTVEGLDNDEKYYFVVTAWNQTKSSNASRETYAVPTTQDDTDSPAQLAFAKKNQTDYEIYAGMASSPVQQQAVTELQQYLSQVTGAEFAIKQDNVNPTEDSLLIIGQDNTLTKQLAPDLDYDEMGQDGFAMKTVGDDLIITGPNPRGTLYGAYYLLDHLAGIKWFGPDFTKVPDKDTLTIDIDKLNQMQKPRFQYREMFNLEADDAAYSHHNMLNGRSHQRLNKSAPSGLDTWSSYWPLHRSSFFEIVSRDEYHYGGQLKMMDEDVRQIASDELTKKINNLVEKGKKPSHGFFQQDTGWTPDDESNAFAEEHGNALSAPIIDMVNDVADRVSQQIPKARISTQAYKFSLKPPIDMTVADNVVITFAPIEADFGQPLNGSNNQDIADNLEGWSNIADNIVIWNYMTDFGSYLQPFPAIKAMGQSIQFAAQYPAVKGYFGQGAYSTVGANFSVMKDWVGARLLWDPDLDVQDVMDQFVDGYYGDAAPYINQYMDLMRQSVEDTNTYLSEQALVTDPYLNFETMNQADQLFALAEQAVADQPDILEHVQTARIGVDYVILMRRAEFQKVADKEGTDWNPNTDTRLARFKEYVEQAEITKYKEGGDSLESLYDVMEIDRAVPSAPDIVHGLQDSMWQDYQDLSMEKHAGAKIVFDEKASDHAAVKLTGQTDAWGIQMQLGVLPPEGKWKLYVVARSEKGDGKPNDKAFTVGVYPPFGNDREVSVAEVSDEQYHTFALPGSYEKDAGHYIYFAPQNNTSIENLYVDRIIAVDAMAAKYIDGKQKVDDLNHTIDQLADDGQLNRGQTHYLKGKSEKINEYMGQAINAYKQNDKDTTVSPLDKSLKFANQMYKWVGKQANGGKLTAETEDQLKSSISDAQNRLNELRNSLLQVKVSISLETNKLHPGDTAEVTTKLANEGGEKLHNVGVNLKLPDGWNSEVMKNGHGVLKPGGFREVVFNVKVPKSERLVDNVPIQMVATYKHKGGEGNVVADTSLSIESPITVQFADEGPYFLDGPEDTAAVDIVVANQGTSSMNGSVKLAAPQGWTVTPDEVDYSKLDGGAKTTLSFTVQAPDQDSSGGLTATGYYGDKKGPKQSTLISTSKDTLIFQDSELLNPVADVVSDSNASDGSALRMPGNTDAWGVQFHLDNLPEEGEWKLFVDARTDKGEGLDSDLAFRYGSDPPTKVQHTTVGDSAGTEYKTYDVDGTFTGDSNQSFWLAPPKSDAIEYVYVDNVTAVRQP